MSIPSWANTFPRLCDLYLESERGHPNNYFEHKRINDNLLRQPPDADYIELEQVFSLMDSDDWSEFKRRTKPYVTAKDHWGWNTQIIERFHEARGYAFLKKQGYSTVHFIQENQNQMTPDLLGIGNQGVALLEAKRIRDSDEDNAELVKTREALLKEKKRIRGSEKENAEPVISMEPEILPMHEGVHSLPEVFKKKLNSTVQVAKEQLNNYHFDNVGRRILYLSIRLDLKCATNEVKQQIEQYLSQVREDLEIVHRIENDFFLDDLI